MQSAQSSPSVTPADGTINGVNRMQHAATAVDMGRHSDQRRKTFPLLSLALLLLQLGLAGCQVAPTPFPPSSATAPAEATVVGAKSVAASTPTMRPTPSPTLGVRPSATQTQTPGATVVVPTATAPTPTVRPSPTVEPTLTPLPTVTVAQRGGGTPRVTIAQPVIGMFLPSPVEVAGKVANVPAGQVRLQAQTPNGQSLGLPPMMAATSPVTDGLAFSGTLQLGYAPTPRSLLITAEYLDPKGVVRAFAQQPVNVVGRFARLQYIVVEAPLPFTRGSDPSILVRGATPGPPKSVLVRLLDAQEHVLDSVPALLGWYQPGLPCDFTASVPNRPEGASIQVLSLGENDKVIEQARVRLGVAVP